MISSTPRRRVSRWTPPQWSSVRGRPRLSRHSRWRSLRCPSSRPSTPSRGMTGGPPWPLHGARCTRWMPLWTPTTSSPRWARTAWVWSLAPPLRIGHFAGSRQHWGAGASRTTKWTNFLGTPSGFSYLTVHSNIPRDQRQYLGNWTTESTADIYTREKRNVVTRVWEEVANKLPSLNLGGARLVREDLDHPDWEDPMVVTIDDAGAGQPSTPPGTAPHAEAGEPGDSPPERPLRPTPESTGSWDLVEKGKVPADSVADSTGPWRVISTTMRRKGAQIFKVHLLDTHGRTIGCGWTPNLARVTELSVDDYVADIDSHICCERCFKNHTFPQNVGSTWLTRCPSPGGGTLSIFPWLGRLPHGRVSWHRLGGREDHSGDPE